MPTIPGGTLDNLRAADHRTSIYISFENPTALWHAQVNGTLDRGETVVPFQNGSGVDFSAVGVLQEVWVGTSQGTKNIGVFRIRDITSGDGGITGTLTVAKNTVGTLDGHWLTFWIKYPLRPKYPHIDEDGNFFKDGDVPYTDQNESVGPVVIAGPNFAGWMSAGSWEIDPGLERSYPMTPGSSLVNYEAHLVYPTSGATININSGTGEGTIEFTQPGQYWIRYVVDDSDGKRQTSYRWYQAHDVNNPPYTDFAVGEISGDWERGDWTTAIKTGSFSPVESIPEGAICVIWQDAHYGSTALIPDPDAGQGVVISGYLRKETVTQQLETGVGDADFVVESITQLLRNQYMFSVSLAARPDPEYWFEYRAELTVGQAVHHLWQRHSTLLQIADVFDLADNVDGRAYAEMEEGSLYTMADDLARSKGIRVHVTCSRRGGVHLTPDVQLLTDSERSVLPTVMNIEALDRSGELVIMRSPQNSVAFVKTSGFSFTKTFYGTVDDCPDPPCPDVEPLCASAPGLMPGDEGVGVLNFDRQIFRDQTHCNEIAGRYYAAANNPYQLYVTFHGNYLPYMYISLPEFWTIDVAQSENPRGIAFVDKNIILRQVIATFNADTGFIECVGTYEAEAEGFAGEAGYCLDHIPDPPGDDEIIPPVDPGETGSLYSASSVHWRGESGLWFQLTAEDTNDMVYGPFDGLLWRCGVGYVKQSLDGGETWSDVTPTEGPAGTEVLDYVALDASYALDRVYVLANDTTNGTAYVYLTVDGGLSWTFIQIGSGGGPTTSPEVDVLGPIRHLKTTEIHANLSLTFGSEGSAAMVGNDKALLPEGLLCFPTAAEYTVASYDRDGNDFLSENEIEVASYPNAAARGVLTYVEGSQVLYVWDEVDPTADPPPPYEPSTLRASVFTHTGTGIVQGIIHTVDSVGSGNVSNVQHMAVIPLKEPGNDPRFLLVYDRRRTDVIPAVYDRYSVILTVQGSGVTSTIPNLMETRDTLGSPISSCNVGPGVAAVAHEIPTGGRLQILEISGNAVTVADTITYPDSGSAFGTIGAVGSTGGKVFVSVGFSTCDACQRIIRYDWDGSTLTEEVTMSLEEDMPPSSVYDTGEAVHIVPYNDYWVWVFYQRPQTFQFVGGESSIIAFRAYPVDGSSPGPLTTLDLGGTSPYFNRATNNTLIAPQDDLAILYFTHHVAGDGIGNGDCPDVQLFPSAMVIDVTPGTGTGSGPAVGLGISSSRSGGDFWVTYESLGTLFADRYDSTGVLLDTFDLGSASTEQLENRERIAYPFADWVEADHCYIFGRMDSAAGSGPARIALAAGSTMTVVDNSIPDTVGALYVETDGTISAIETGGTIAKLWRGTVQTGMSLVGNLPIIDVLPKALVADFINGDLYAGSNNPEPMMVLKANPPFVEWTDITTNHPTNNPINALVLIQ